MPFTPFHLGPALLIGLVAYKHLDMPTLLIASVTVDVRTALVFFGILEGPLHGILHTFLIGTVLAFGLIGAITPFRGYIKKQMDKIGLNQKYDDSTIVGAAFLGIYSHIFLDAILYTDITPFYPLNVNPLLGAASTSWIYGLCIFCGIIGLAAVPWKIHSLSDKSSLQN